MFFVYSIVCIPSCVWLFSTYIGTRTLSDMKSYVDLIYFMQQDNSWYQFISDLM